MEYNPALGRKIKDSVDAIQMRYSPPPWIADLKESQWNLEDPISTGMYFAEVDGIPFHFLLRDRFSASDRVMVSFTPGAYGSKRDDGPRFSRWKYAECTDASLICVDDPMVYLYGLRYGWFGGGTEEKPMWASAGELIMAIVRACGLENPKIMFVSSSSGGTASILVSSVIGLPCTVVAMNPQLYLPANVNYRKAASNGLNSLLVKDKDFITDAIKRHQENRYLIMTNMASRVDYERHLMHLCDSMSAVPRFGITTVGNVMNWIYYAPAAVPHNAMDWIALYPVMEFLAQTFESGAKLPDNLLDAFTRIIGEHHEANKRLLIERAGEDPEIVKKAVVFANSGDFDVLDAAIDKVSRSEMKQNTVCTAISNYPEHGFHCACSIMSRGLLSADAPRMRLIAPIVCAKAFAKDEDAQKAVRSVIESPKTKASVLGVMASCIRGLPVEDSFFLSNALIDILWRLNTPEALAEMTALAERSAAKGNARALARMSKMYYYGRGYKRDLDEAERLAREALNSGVPWARSIINKVKKKREATESSPSDQDPL